MKFQRAETPGVLLFECPGCDMLHAVYVQGYPHQGPIWGWNGDLDRPTITPSLRVRYPHWEPPARAGLPAPENQVRVDSVCHSFIRDGRIEFLGDCTHALAGQTVDLPDIEE